MDRNRERIDNRRQQRNRMNNHQRRQQRNRMNNHQTRTDARRRYRMRQRERRDQQIAENALLRQQLEDLRNSNITRAHNNQGGPVLQANVGICGNEGTHNQGRSALFANVVIDPNAYQSNQGNLIQAHARLIGNAASQEVVHNNRLENAIPASQEVVHNT